MNNSSKHDSVEVEETVKVQLSVHNKDYNCNTYQFLPMECKKSKYVVCNWIIYVCHLYEVECLINASNIMILLLS